MKYPRPDEAVSAFDAKTHLSSLLRETERGASYLILRHGKPVARLVPCPPEEPADYPALADSFRKIRSEVRGKVSTRSLIDEGRRR
ncbi:MAG: type II toxin-antitoxin system prevent-host-death family antitoxin [Elusimicrobia bacterium]|nr:type II toxin-antitoxin system prevent-host-death family antitoxin [Elusimicrobiota bacterium]